MHSIRTKFTVITAGSIIIAIAVATMISVFSIRSLGRQDADQLLHLMCRTGAMNLESYFQSVENSVETVSTLVQDSFQDMPLEQLETQVERARHLFSKVAYNTNGVLTYYLRIDPEVSETVKGFWYVNLDGNGFKEHKVTDITLYDTSDTTALVWFTIPKATGEGVWLPPYITDNLDRKVISYNVPIYWEDLFIGVIGIEIYYETLAREVENIRLYENGYAFILDENNAVIYHPRQDVFSSEADLVSTCTLISGDSIRYEFQDVKKDAVYTSLSNGMRLFVTVPESEIDSGWQALIERIMIASLIQLALVIFITMHFSSHLTRPLQELTMAARQVDLGNYDFTLNYLEDDELGMLTRTFRTLAENTKDQISTLNKQVYVDALTSVRNKGAYADYIQKLQDQIDSPTGPLAFGVGVFDCDNLKMINDTYGHDKGDEYLKATSRLICSVFQHSPVFRIGGDEFAVILQNEDLQNRAALIDLFEKKRKEACDAGSSRWEQVHVAFGLAVYDPETDPAVIDVARRADQRMYENKRKRKAKARQDRHSAVRRADAV